MLNDTTIDLVIARLEKCHLLLSNQSSNSYAKIGGEIILNSSNVNLLGITIDSALSFDMHVIKLCKKANQKSHTLARLSNYMEQDKLSF